MALRSGLGSAALCRRMLRGVGGCSTATPLTFFNSRHERRTFSADTMQETREHQAAEPMSPPQMSHEEKKAKISSVWNSSAESYVRSFQEGGMDSGSPPGMAVGYKLAARFVSFVANKRCEAVVLDGKEMCKARATHGEAEEGATVCGLHKTDGMVQLRKAGALVVLDIASAGGEPAMTIAKAVPNAAIHATDVAPVMVELLRKRIANAGVSNVTASVADGEALTDFGDDSVDVLTCTWGLMFMPDWRRSVQEFSRVVKGDGMVVLTLWEKHEDSIFERIASVLETLTPGFKGLIEPEVLGDDAGAAVAAQMEATGLSEVTVSQFSVPMVLPEAGGAREIWDHCAVSTPLGQTLSTLEAKGRTNVRQEALEIFENQMKADWAKGLSPLGLSPIPDTDGVGSSSSGDSSDGKGSEVGTTPRMFFLRALIIVGRK